MSSIELSLYPQELLAPNTGLSPSMIHTYFVIFGCGLLIGSIIGTTGIVLIFLLTTSYYFKDNINTLLGNFFSPKLQHLKPQPSIPFSFVSNWFQAKNS